MDTPGWAVEALREGRVGRLATADAGARPLVVPACYAFDGARVYVAVDAKPKRTRDLRRLRHIRENPRVSLVVDRWDEDWRQLWWVIVEGAAAVLEPGEEFARGVALLLAKYPQYVAMDLATTASAVIRIAPDRILAWRATAPDGAG